MKTALVAAILGLSTTLFAGSDDPPPGLAFVRSIIWGEATNGVRAGLYLVPKPPASVTGKAETRVEVYVESSPAYAEEYRFPHRLNVPPLAQCYEAELRTDDERVVPKTALGKKQGIPVSSELRRSRRRGWMSRVCYFPHDVAVIPIEEH